jgi:hypothetical protein
MESQEAKHDQRLEHFSDDVVRDAHAEHVSADTHDPERPAACADTLQFPSWQVPYLNALLELDPEKLCVRIATAEAAIFARLSQIVIARDANREQQAINYALHALAGLKSESLLRPRREPN